MSNTYPPTHRAKERRLPPFSFFAVVILFPFGINSFGLDFCHLQSKSPDYFNDHMGLAVRIIYSSRYMKLSLNILTSLFFFKLPEKDKYLRREKKKKKKPNFSFFETV